MPFIITQQLHMPPASIWHRLWTVPQATLSSHEQVMLMPPWHFSIFIVQRGVIAMPMPIPGMPVIGLMLPAPMPGIPIIPRSIIMLAIMAGFIAIYFRALRRVRGAEEM